MDGDCRTSLANEHDRKELAPRKGSPYENLPDIRTSIASVKI